MAMGLFVFGGCSPAASETPEPASSASGAPATPVASPVDVNVVALKGPTAIGMVQMMDQVDSGKITSNNYDFSISAAVDEVPPKIVKGDVDIAAVPANLASVLYNSTKGEVQVLAINTLGVLYLVENGTTVQSLSELKGKTIYASGKGATPEYVLNYLLEQGGLDPAADVTIEWLPEHAACVAALAQNPEGIALLPQPFVTTAQMQNPDLRIAVDLTKEWEANSKDSSLITGVVVARKEFVEQNPEAIQDFLEHYQSSVNYVNSNVDAAAVLVGKYDIVPEAVAKKAIPFCNIVCITGSELQEQLSGYLEVLSSQNPESIGGTLPSKDFYYST
jgi:NitT/TauT family transport system substrate-binding protein